MKNIHIHTNTTLNALEKGNPIEKDFLHSFLFFYMYKNHQTEQDDDDNNDFQVSFYHSTNLFFLLCTNTIFNGGGE